MQVFVTARSYYAELTTQQFLDVLAFDEAQERKGAAILAELMEAAGATHVEYNGHFGPAIFFTLADDLSDQFANVILLINNYIKVAEERTSI